MHNAKLFDAFIDLVKFDRMTMQIKKSIEHILEQVQQLKQKEATVLYEYETLKDELVKFKKIVDAEELAMQELDEAAQGKRQQLELLTDHKGYRALNAELEHIHTNQQAQEQKVVNAWNAFESAQARLAQHVPLYQQRKNECHERMQQLQVDVVRMQQELNVHEKDRSNKRELVPNEWLDRYEVMQARVSDPVVPIEHDSCSTCFYHLTGSDVQHAKRGELIQCRGCYRLLFVPDIMQKI